MSKPVGKMSDEPIVRPSRLDLREDAAPDAVSQALLRGVGGRFGLLFDRAGFGMALLGTDGSIVLANPALAELLGRDRAEVQSIGLTGLIHADELVSVRVGMESALAGGDATFELEARLRSVDGVRWALLSGSLVSDDRGRPLCFLLQAHDVTPRRLELTELEEAYQRKTRVVAVASHELRTPLTSVLGFAKTLFRHGDKISDKDRHEYLGNIVEQGERLARMVSDMLTISRIEGGSLKIDSEPVEIGPCIRQVVEQLACPTEVRLRGTVDARVIADPHHLQQIVTNFLTNAFKYGAPPVEAEIRADGDWIEIRIKDRGDGVPEEFVPRLFDPFSRADSGRARTQGGTGLGLSIVRGLARAQGGDIWYEKNEPLGACFVARLPAAS